MKALIIILLLVISSITYAQETCIYFTTRGNDSVGVTIYEVVDTNSIVIFNKQESIIYLNDSTNIVTLKPLKKYIIRFEDSKYECCVHIKTVDYKGFYPLKLTINLNLHQDVSIRYNTKKQYYEHLYYPIKN